MKQTNCKQYMTDLLVSLKDPEQQTILKNLIHDIPDDAYEKADAKYRSRRYPEKSLSFYMTGRCTDYLMTLSGSAFKVLHYMATYMSQDNLCVAPVSVLSEILDMPERSLKRYMKELKDSGAITYIGLKHDSCPIYEVDQTYVSYGVRPSGIKVIKDYIPSVVKEPVKSKDPESPKMIYVGKLQKIQPGNVVGFKNKHHSNNKVDVLIPFTPPKECTTPEQLLEGLL